MPAPSRRAAPKAASAAFFFGDAESAAAFAIIAR